MRHYGFANIIRCSISRSLSLSAVSGTFDSFFPRKITAMSSLVRKSRFSSNTSDNANYRSGDGGRGSKSQSNSLMKTKKVSNFIAGYKGDHDDTFTNEEIEQEQKLSGNLTFLLLLFYALLSCHSIVKSGN